MSSCLENIFFIQVGVTHLYCFTEKHYSTIFRLWILLVFFNIAINVLAQFESQSDTTVIAEQNRLICGQSLTQEKHHPEDFCIEQISNASATSSIKQTQYTSLAPKLVFRITKQKLDKNLFLQNFTTQNSATFYDLRGPPAV